MSRSGYTDDCENLWLWRASVKRALRGKRGQAFLREMLAALDALPAPRLIAHELEEGGEVCALGSVTRARGIDVTEIDPYDRDEVANLLGIAEAMTAEIADVNDSRRDATPEDRFARVRAWVVANLRPPAGSS